MIINLTLATFLPGLINASVVSANVQSREVTVGDVDNQYIAEVQKLKMQEQVVLAPETGRFMGSGEGTITFDALLILIIVSVVIFASLEVRHKSSKRK